MASEHLLLVIVKLFIVGIGAAIVLATYGAHKRMGSTMMLFISIGFGILTMGSMVEGMLFEFFGYTLLDVHIIESTIVLSALLVIIYSLRRLSA